MAVVLAATNPVAAAAIGVVATSIVGGFLGVVWDRLKSQRDRDAQAVELFYSTYGEWFTTWKLYEASRDWQGGKYPAPWPTARDLSESDPPNLVPSEHQAEVLDRVTLLERASRAEGSFEALLVKITNERRLNDGKRDDLGRFRQGYQQLRESIEKDARLHWNVQGHGVEPYLAFRVLSSEFARLLRGPSILRPFRTPRAGKAAENLAKVASWRTKNGMLWWRDRESPKPGRKHAVAMAELRGSISILKRRDTANLGFGDSPRPPDWLTLPTMAVIAHRGGAALGPENSLEAVNAAACAGVAAVEVDVQELGDGSLVVLHNDHFGEGNGEIPLHKIDADRFEALVEPREPLHLDDLLDNLPSAELGLYIDVKAVSSAGVVRIIEEVCVRDLASRCVIGSFDEKIVRQVVADRRVSASILFSDRDADPVARAADLGCTLVHPCFDDNAMLNSLAGEWMQRLKARHILVIGWNTVDPAALRKMRDIGMRAVCTDDPRIQI